MKSARERAGDEIRHFMRQYARFVDSTLSVLKDSAEPITPEEAGQLLDVIGALDKAEKCMKK